jgi:hypothetical protein
VSLLLGGVYPVTAAAPGGVAFGDVTAEGTYRAFFLIQNDGAYYQRADGILTQLGAWISPQVGMNLYECRATANDITPPPGTYGTWLDLAQSWSWGWNFSQRTTFHNRFDIGDGSGGFDYEPSTGLEARSCSRSAASLTRLLSPVAT